MKLARYSTNVLLALTVALAASAACAGQDRAAEGSFDRTLKVSGAVNLTVETGSGSIAVRAGDSSAVHISAKIRVNEGWHVSMNEAKEKVSKLEANPPIEQQGNTIHIGEIRDEELRRNVSISYEISAPAETQLRSSTGSGSQTLEGLKGPLEVSTGSGGLHISRIGSEVRATTGSGSIILEEVNGSVHASAGSGGIRANGVAGGLTARTGSGTVEFSQTAPGDVDVETGSGGVDLRGLQGRVRVHAGSGSLTAEGKPTGDWDLHTASGSVTLRLPANAAFNLEASTAAGNISTTHEMTVTGNIGGGHHEVHGKVNGGGPVISAHTSSGSIRVE
jgi:Putative adhesin